MASCSASHPERGPEKKRPRMEGTGAEPPFPAEIWEHVFRYIPGSQLLQLRLISRRWSEIISSSPSLMGRFYVSFRKPKGALKMDESYVPAGLPPMAVKALLQKCVIVDSGALRSWWPAFAKKLTELQIGEGQISAGNLFWMLQQAPNLKNLVLFRIRFFGSDSGDMNIRLERLEGLAAQYLRYDDSGHRDILVGLEQKFPSLKELRLDVAIDKKEAQILQSVRTLQGTLQRLQLPRGKTILAELSKMERLRLKELLIDVQLPQDAELLAEFCKKQPQLEELAVTANQAAVGLNVLHDTGRALPNLKRIVLTIRGSGSDDLDNFGANDGGMEMSFVDAMPALEVLEIYGDYGKLTFAKHKCPNLIQFHMNDVETEDLFQFLQRSPKLAKIYLSDCRLGYREVSVTRHFRSLKVLSLEDIICQADLMVSLFGHSPLLEELNLAWLKYLGDEHVLVACKRLRRLKKLSLVSIRCMTDESAKYIQRYCPVLEELEADFSDSVLDRLAADKKIRIKRVNSDFGEDSGEDDSDYFDEEDDYDEDEVVDQDDE